jgi:hypothetical protein
MNPCLHHFASLLIGLCCVTFSSVSDNVFAADTDISPKQREFVQSKVLPLLQSRCFECHDGQNKSEGGLLLTSRSLLLKGGDSGEAVVPGKPDESLLIEAIRYESLEMPPRSKMPEAEIDILVRWVEMGAPWPKDLEADHVAAQTAAPFPLEERRKSHWAWQPVRNPEVPPVAETSWPADPVDYFILSRLEEAGLSPAPDVDRQTLIRRLYFDLIGLAPTPEEVGGFVDDPDSDLTATKTVVDRLLASPQFGERWGRHWLDLVRYAETLGHEFDYPLHHAWQYRDYVIRALNEDVPYDQFMREHVAGDLMPEPRRHPTEHYNESLIGTGFWFLHEDKHSPVDVEYDEAVKIDNQIDVFSRTFMGLTVACARCHDHKFDAISTKDYYSLFGILQSTRRRTGWLDPGRKIAAVVDELASLQEQANQLLSRLRSDDDSSGVPASYAKAAIELCQSGEDSSASAVQQIAADNGLSPDHLKEWTKQLNDPKAQDLTDSRSLLARLATADGDADVQQTVSDWTKQVNSALTANTGSELFADFSQGLPEGWTTTGSAFPKHERAAVAVSGGRHPMASSGFSSGDLSTRLRGSLYSPTFEITHPDILIRIAGEGARVRLVIDGYVMMEFNGLLFRGIDRKVDTKGEFEWLRLGEDAHRYIGRHAYIEVMDQGDGWFVIDQVRFAEKRNGPPPPVVVSAVNVALSREIGRNLPHDPVASAAHHLWPALFAAGLLPSSTNESWTALQTAWSNAAKDTPEAVPVLSVTEGTGEDQHVFIRGNHKNHGEVAHRAFLTAIAGSDQPPVQSGSGRRELAAHLIAEHNPLPARVAVNRIWHHLFGRGIVASTDDFGVLGTAPSHPKLLDHLAQRFRSDGWSLKKMIRQLVLTRSYRMSSRASANAQEKDPANVLLHSARVRRLQGEVIRDTMLQLAGHLDLTQFGPSVPVALTPFMQGRGRPKPGPLDGNGRRSIYISVNRNFLSPFMLAFDTPAPMSTRGRRSVSNVPAQALIMLNDEFAHQQAKRWAESLLTESSPTDVVLSTAWQQAIGRRPTDAELAALASFAETQSALKDKSSKGLSIDVAILADVCHAIMNTKEFIYIR